MKGFVKLHSVANSAATLWRLLSLYDNFMMLETKARACLGGRQKGGFPKGWFWRMFPWNETGTRVHSDVPPERKPERGYARMFPRNENRNEGTFAKTTLLGNRPLISQWVSWGVVKCSDVSQSVAQSAGKAYDTLWCCMTVVHFLKQLVRLPQNEKENVPKSSKLREECLQIL